MAVFIDRPTDRQTWPTVLISRNVYRPKERQCNIPNVAQWKKKETLRAKIPTFRRRTQDKSTAEVNEGLHKTA